MDYSASELSMDGNVCALRCSLSRVQLNPSAPKLTSDSACFTSDLGICRRPLLRRNQLKMSVARMPLAICEWRPLTLTLLLLLLLLSVRWWLEARIAALLQKGPSFCCLSLVTCTNDWPGTFHLHATQHMDIVCAVPRLWWRPRRCHPRQVCMAILLPALLHGLGRRVHGP